MKIPSDSQRILGVYGKGKEIKNIGKSSEVGMKKDEISISEKARDFQTVMKAMKKIPEIREDKCENIAKQYEAGTYGVPGKDIVDKLFKSIDDNKKSF